MRRFAVLVASAAMSLAIALPVTAAEPTPTLYIAMGDSLATGDGASVPNHTGYVPRLAGYFQGDVHGGADTLINLAVGGTTTGDLIAGQLPAAVALIGDPDTDTRVITLSVGGNDLLDLINDEGDVCLSDPAGAVCQGMLAAALGGVAANMPVILGTLHAALASDPGDEKIFVLLPYNAFTGIGHPLEALIATVMRGADMAFDCGALGNPANVGLNDILGCAALAAGDVVVDAYPLFEGRVLELTHIAENFNVHPNDEGYEVIAKAHRVADRAS